MQLFLQTLIFKENLISYVKQLLLFSMLDSKLWYNKRVSKNVKGAKMMVFNKTCEQFPSAWVTMIRA